ncbi:hypothetical protein V493_00138 [Pseudogymnoascus sp. VKM F-4281 (FW-2241)]|nr:hypothetical protein V493_00138 [Pseudogymnoascus sp. VKM F-4281 (FW-2241)]
MATIAAINPFPNDVRATFDSYIKSPQYSKRNRERIPYAKWCQMCIFLTNSTLKPQNPTESNLRHRTLTNFHLIDEKLYRNPDIAHKEPRYVVLENEALDLIISEHLQLLHAGRDKVWASIQQKYYGISRQEVAFVLKLCKNCVLNRPATTKAPLVPIISSQAWERVQIDLIDMRHEPSGQYKWILHIKDHFSKYTQLYPLKSKHAEPIAECFAQFIAAFLPPKIMQADNGKEFKGALLLLLRKYGIQVVNGAPRSPQTQGLIEQANGVVENKLRAWKMDHGSTEWKNGLLEVVLAMNTQIHSTIGCAPAELLFRERSSHIDWLNSQAWKDLSIGIEQEDPTMGPIFESELQPELESETEALIDPRLRQREPELNYEPSSGSEPELRIELNSDLRTRARVRSGTRARAQLQLEPELRIELSGSELRIELSSGSERAPEPEREPERELWLSSILSSEPESSILIPSEHQSQSESQSSILSSVAEPEFCSELESSRLQARAPDPGIESSGSELNSEPSSSSKPELRRGSRPRVPAQPRTELRATPDPVIERAIVATQRARISMVRKYTKKHDIQHFDIGAIVSIKVPREDRTSTDNKRLFARILEEPYPHRYRILTASGIIQRLIPTKSLRVVEQALWGDIVIPTSTKEVGLGLAAREASTSARVGISCQCKGLCSTKRCRCYKEAKECSVHCHNDDHDCGYLSGLAIRTEIALVERPKRKRARADTVGNTI